MNVNTIIAGLHVMSEDEVRKINQAAYDILNGARKKKIAAKKRELYTGMWVKFEGKTCLLYTSPSPRDRTRSRMPSSA